jgi:Eukaryotic aspartyl protease
MDVITGADLTDVIMRQRSWPQDALVDTSKVNIFNPPPPQASLEGPIGMPSNSIVDSGTNSLNISQQMLSAMISKFSQDQQLLLTKSIYQSQLVPMSKLRLDEWPTISFVMEGDTGYVKLDVTPSNYWQVNTQNVGYAAAAITQGQPGLAILGLPLMNGYFTIFDGEADGGKGVIKFATIR